MSKDWRRSIAFNTAAYENTLEGGHWQSLVFKHGLTQVFAGEMWALVFFKATKQFLYAPKTESHRACQEANVESISDSRKLTLNLNFDHCNIGKEELID